MFIIYYYTLKYSTYWAFYSHRSEKSEFLEIDSLLHNHMSSGYDKDKVIH